MDQSLKASKETQCEKAALGETEEEKTKLDHSVLWKRRLKGNVFVLFAYFMK